MDSGSIEDIFKMKLNTVWRFANHSDHFHTGEAAMKKTFGVVLVLVMALAMAGSVWGQAQITTGVIHGTVVDADRKSVV